MLIFSITIITVYIIIIYTLFGQLPSISQSYYEFGKKFKKWGHYLFSITLILYAFPLMLEGLNLAQNSPFQFLMFLAPAGILFTASAPQFKESLTDKVHYIGAVTGITLGLLATALIFKLILAFIAITSILFIITLLPIKNKLFWIEVIAIYFIHITLMYIKYYT